MKEKNQIDEIIKNGLKNFEPDFNELHWDEMEAMLDKEHPVPGSVFTRYRKYFYSFSALFLLLIVGYFIGISKKNISTNLSSNVNTSSVIQSSSSSSVNTKANITSSSKSDLETVATENASARDAKEFSKSDSKEEQGVKNSNNKNNTSNHDQNDQKKEVVNSTISNSTNYSNLNAHAITGQREVVKSEASLSANAIDQSKIGNNKNNQSNDALNINIETPYIPNSNSSIQNTDALDIEFPSNNNGQINNGNNEFEDDAAPNVETLHSIDELADLNTDFLGKIKEEYTELSNLEGKFSDIVEGDELLVSLEAKKIKPGLRYLPKTKRPVLLGLGFGGLSSLEMNFVDKLDNSQLGNSQGVFVEYNFGKIFGIEMAFVLTNKIYQSTDVNDVPYVPGDIENSQIKYSMIEIPLLARFKFRKNKAFQPHIGTGHSVYIPRKEKYFFVADLELDEEYENDYDHELETGNFESVDPRDPRVETSEIFVQDRGPSSSTGVVEPELLPMEEMSGPLWGIINLSAGFDWRFARNHKLRLEGQFKSSINKLVYDLRVADYGVSNKKRYKSLGARLSYVLSL